VFGVYILTSLTGVVWSTKADKAAGCSSLDGRHVNELQNISERLAAKEPDDSRRFVGIINRVKRIISGLILLFPVEAALHFNYTSVGTIVALPLLRGPDSCSEKLFAE